MRRTWPDLTAPGAPYIPTRLAENFPRAVDAGPHYYYYRLSSCGSIRRDRRLVSVSMERSMGGRNGEKWRARCESMAPSSTTTDPSRKPDTFEMKQRDKHLSLWFVLSFEKVASHLNLTASSTYSSSSSSSSFMIRSFSSFCCNWTAAATNNPLTVHGTEINCSAFPKWCNHDKRECLRTNTNMHDMMPPKSLGRFSTSHMLSIVNQSLPPLSLSLS